MPVGREGLIIIDKEFVPQNAEDVFYKYKAEIIEDLRQNLINKDKDQPGKLIQSIDVDIETKGTKITFALSMEDYWKFVDEGVDGYKNSRGSQYKFKQFGKRIPINGLKKFIAARGISPNKKIVTSGKKRVVKKKKVISKEKQLDSLAFAIGVRIKEKGIEPTHFYTDVINPDLIARMTKDLTIALGKDIELNIKESIK